MSSLRLHAHLAAVQVTSTDVHYRALDFYMAEHPDLLVDLLGVLQTRLDHAKVVDIFGRRGQLPLIKEYLVTAQKSNVQEVSEHTE